MTVSSTVREAQSACNGVTTVFSCPFQYQPGGLVVSLIDNLTLAATVLSLSTDYFVTGDGAAGTAQVVTAIAYPTGKSLLRRRETPLTQERSYSENDGFPAKEHEGALDQLTMIVQELTERVALALTGDPELRGDLASIAGGTLVKLSDGSTVQAKIAAIIAALNGVGGNADLLRGDLAAVGGAEMIGTAAGQTVQARLNALATMFGTGTPTLLVDFLTRLNALDPTYVDLVLGGAATNSANDLLFRFGVVVTAGNAALKALVQAQTGISNTAYAALFS